MELGQIEPAIGSWIPGGEGGHLFAIEVGERRFWGLALAAVQQGMEAEPVLRVIEESQFSRARQIAENIQREGNTAVDRARAIAGLILLGLDRHPDPELEDDLAYFRQVLDIRRLPNGTWPPLERQRPTRPPFGGRSFTRRCLRYGARLPGPRLGWVANAPLPGGAVHVHFARAA